MELRLTMINFWILLSPWPSTQKTAIQEVNTIIRCRFPVNSVASPVCIWVGLEDPRYLGQAWGMRAWLQHSQPVSNCPQASVGAAGWICRFQRLGHIFHQLIGTVTRNNLPTHGTKGLFTSFHNFLNTGTCVQALHNWLKISPGTSSERYHRSTHSPRKTTNHLRASTPLPDILWPGKAVQDRKLNCIRSVIPWRSTVVTSDNGFKSLLRNHTRNKKICLLSNWCSCAKRQTVWLALLESENW